MIAGSIIIFLFIILPYSIIKISVLYRKCKRQNNSINEDEIADIGDQNAISDVLNENEVDNIVIENENNYLENQNQMQQEDAKVMLLKKYRFSFSFSCAALVFYGLMIPFMEKRWRLTIMLTIVVFVLAIIVVAIELYFRYKKSFKILFYQKRIGGFLVNCLSLLVIPSTEIFFELIEEKQYKTDWYIKSAYIYNSLALPLLLIIAMIVLKHPNIEEKYRQPESCKFNFFYLYEFIDMASQIAYAVCVAKDLLIACLCIEIFVFVLIVSFRPFSSVSEHFLSGGNSLILIISNGTLYYFSKHESKYLSLGWSIGFIVIACIPAILSFYLFFFFDFEIKPEDEEFSTEEVSEEKEEAIICDSIMKLCKFATFLSPFVWFFLSLNLPYIIMKFNFNE